MCLGQCFSIYQHGNVVSSVYYCITGQYALVNLRDQSFEKMWTDKQKKALHLLHPSSLSSSTSSSSSSWSSPSRSSFQLYSDFMLFASFPNLLSICDLFALFQLCQVFLTSLSLLSINFGKLLDSSVKRVGWPCWPSAVTQVRDDQLSDTQSDMSHSDTVARITQSHASER